MRSTPSEHEFEQSASFAERHVFGTISMKRICGGPSGRAGRQAKRQEQLPAQKELFDYIPKCSMPFAARPD